MTTQHFEFDITIYLNKDCFDFMSRLLERNEKDRNVFPIGCIKEMKKIESVFNMSRSCVYRRRRLIDNTGALW